MCQWQIRASPSLEVVVEVGVGVVHLLPRLHQHLLPRLLQLEVETTAEGMSMSILAQVSRYNLKSKNNLSSLILQLQMWPKHIEVKHQGSRRAECLQGRGWMAGRPL